MLEKIKKFGSISKNEISKGISKIAKKRSSLGSLSTSQSKFYENAEIDGDASPSPKYDSKSLNVKAKGLSKLQRLGRLTISKLPTNFNLSEPYENTIYQENQMSSPNLSKSMNEVTSPGNQAAAAVNKSLRTKLRKSFTPLIGSSSTSNIYGSLSSKSSTFYVTESLDVDSGIFSLNGKATTSPNNSNLSLSSNSNTASVTCDIKRRSISTAVSSRPNDPPPPPPSEKNSTELHETLQACSLEQSNDSPATWFKDFELFKDVEASDRNGEAENKKSMSSWYTEIGLYQTSNNSITR